MGERGDERMKRSQVERGREQSWQCYDKYSIRRDKETDAGVSEYIRVGK